MRAKTLIRKGDARQSKAGTVPGQTRKRDAKAEEKLGEKQLKAVKDKELSVADYLAMSEKAIHRRDTVLRCRKKNFLKVLQLGYQLVQRFEDADKM